MHSAADIFSSRARAHQHQCETATATAMWCELLCVALKAFGAFLIMPTHVYNCDALLF